MTIGDPCVVGVVAHPQRESRHRLLCDFAQPEVFCLDDGSLGCANNHIEVLTELLQYPRTARWAVVLEDDAVPCFEFRKQLRSALETSPAPIISLYLGTGNPSGHIQRQFKAAVDTATAKGHSWIMGDCLVPGVGYAIERTLLRDLIKTLPTRSEELTMRITRWAQSRGYPVAYTRPSLVDHEDSDPIGRPWRGSNYLPRKAWSFSTGTDIYAWDTPFTELGHCGNWSIPEAEEEVTDFLPPSKIYG